MNILVTGGCGYIGSHTCLSLIQRGFTPIIIDNLCNSKLTVLDRIETLTGVRPIFYQGDIRYKATFQQIFQAHDIAAVIHFAGLKAVGESVQIPLQYYENNVYGSLVLFESMKAAGVKNLVFSSSATVYGEEAPVPYCESQPMGTPSSPYGKSKMMIERILEDVARVEQGWSITVLRYFNPVGADPSGQMGEDPQGIPNNLMPYISQVAVGRREYLNIFGQDYPTPDGTAIRDYIDVMDLAEGHVVALDKKINQSGLHVYNLGSGQGVSVKQIVDLFSQVCGKPVPYRYAPRREGDLPQFWADADKAKRELGWQTKRTLMETIENAWRWQSQNPQGYPD